MQKNIQNIYVNRLEASKLLKVSTRTLDRYIRQYKIKVKREGRMVFIKRNAVNLIINDHIGHFLGDFKRFKEDGQDVHNVQDALTVKNIKVEQFRAKEEEVYKSLYGELKRELKEKQDRLEAATYRVGQLESQLKNMVPLLEFNKKDKELRESQIALENRLMENQTTLTKMQGIIRSERVAKWVYLSLVGLLLIAEPILFLMWAFS